MMKKEIKKQHSDNSVDLWKQEVKPIPINEYVNAVADTEKLLLFSETGAGKTTFYFNILRILERQGVDKKDMLMYILYPDRPTGISKIYDIIPKEYKESIDVFPVNNYEDTVSSTATAEKLLMEHFEKTKRHGYLVFELLENYWSFAQDYYCRQAYGQSMGKYFAHMMNMSSEEKADKQAAYEAFAGPFGGPWPIIKFFHNFNWIDRVKRMPFNVIFTSEVKEERNKDSIFFDLGLRPAGEKHNMHRVDTILYLSHKGNEFYMKPYKLTGYTRFYNQQKITGRNGYEVHKEALKILEKRGYKTTKIEDIERMAGIELPKIKEKPDTELTMGEAIYAGAKESIDELEKKKETEKEDIKEEIEEDVNWDI